MATWQGGSVGWKLVNGATTPAGTLSRALGYLPTIEGVGQLAGVYYDPNSRVYRKKAAPTAAVQQSAEEKYTQAAVQTVGGLAGVIGGVVGGPTGAQAGVDLGKGLGTIVTGIEGLF